MNYKPRLDSIVSLDPGSATPDDFAAAVALLEDLDEYIGDLRNLVGDLEEDLHEASRNRP